MVKYEKPEMEMIIFGTANVITESNPTLVLPGTDENAGGSEGTDYNSGLW